jgi:hypothetical protein
MHERVTARRSPDVAPTRPPPPKLVVGRARDPLEREADRTAAAVVDALADRRSGPIPLSPGASSRIRRSAYSPPPPVAPSTRISPSSQVVQRVPYLANQDDMIYKDTKVTDIELAYLGGNVAGVRHLFVEYAAVRRVQDIARSLLRSGGPVRRWDAPQSAGGPYSRGGSKHGTQSKAKTKRKPGNVDMGEASYEVRGQMRDAITAKRNTDAALRTRLLDALGTVFEWYDGDDWAQVTDELPAAKLAIVVMRIVEVGPQTLPKGGGSRLPAPSGTIYVAPPLMKQRVLEILGVRPEQMAAYENVAVKGFEDADVYGATLEQLATQGANVFKFGNVDTGQWMAYASDVTTRRSDNSRVQVGGQVYDDAVFAGLHDVNDAQLIAQIKTGYQSLTAATVDSGWVPGADMTVSRDRGDGQSLAMLKWNALGAAAYANRFLGTTYDLRQNWEWLHVRGAQIGGATVGGNLVAGLYATNSFMIPFEAMIKNWATAGPHAFWARFVATGVAGPFAQQIELQIQATGHPELGTLPATTLVRFDPIAGRVVDKLAAEFVKRAIDQTVRV